MYFVDREKIEATLIYLEDKISLFSSQNNWKTPLEKAALERLTQMMLESVLDVGNSIIDGFIMRDPGSYDDIVDILTDENVISEDMSKSLKILISHRKTLVQSYLEIQHADLVEQFRSHLDAIELFPNKVRLFIKNELGPVSAFKN